jgi:AcrR family transcriptional regulator
VSKNADGRIERSERSRRGIVDAMVVIMEQGVYIPTAQQIADEAGVSIRTLFRHFPEMDKLYREVDQVTKPRYLHHFKTQLLTGSIEKRVRSAVDTRISIYIEVAHCEKATHALLWRSTFIQENYRRTQVALRKDMINVLPELKKLSAESREIVDAVTSFEFFERLSTHQNLSEKACRKLIINLVLEQLGIN